IPLNLQYSAEGDVDPKADEIKKSEEAEKAEEVKEPQTQKQPTDKQENDITLTHAEKNKIITDRVERERKAREQENAKKGGKEQGKYKELNEQTQQKIAEMEAERGKAGRDAEIVRTLKSQGLTDEQVESHFKWVEKSVGE